MFNEEDIKKLKIKISKLPKKEIDLIITDFDDTIFSTSEIIKKDIRKWRRWKEWNDYIKKVFWVDKFIEMFYKNKIFPKTIVSKLRKNHDLILTAWDQEIQIKKIIACWLDNINYQIVENAEEKVLESINYIINILKFIPKKIVIYEDRPEFFIEYKKFLENILWTKIIIISVKIVNNNCEPIFEENQKN